MWAPSLKLKKDDVKSGKTLHEKVVKRAEQEKNELLSIYNRIKEEDLETLDRTRLLAIQGETAPFIIKIEDMK